MENYKECKQYLDEIQGAVDSMGSLIRSGNSVIETQSFHLIIESTAEKYGGYVDYFEGNGMFGIQVSIPEPLDKGA